MAPTAAQTETASDMDVMTKGPSDQENEDPGAPADLRKMFFDGMSKIGTHKSENLFQSLEKRTLTDEEQAVIDERVAHQRRMFELFEKREQQRKISEILEVCPDITHEEATRALALCDGREEDAAAALIADPSFKRRVKAGFSSSAPTSDRGQSRPVPSRHNSRNRSNGPRPKFVDPSSLGDSVFVGAFRGKGFQGNAAARAAWVPPKTTERSTSASKKARGASSTGNAGRQSKRPLQSENDDDDDDDDDDDTFGKKIDEKKGRDEEEIAVPRSTSKRRTPNKSGNRAVYGTPKKHARENGQGGYAETVTDSELRKVPPRSVCSNGVKEGSPATSTSADDDDEQDEEEEVLVTVTSRGENGATTPLPAAHVDAMDEGSDGDEEDEMMIVWRSRRRNGEQAILGSPLVESMSAKLARIDPERGLAWLRRMEDSTQAAVLLQLGIEDPERAVELRELLDARAAAADTNGFATGKDTQENTKEGSDPVHAGGANGIATGSGAERVNATSIQAAAVLESSHDGKEDEKEQGDDGGGSGDDDDTETEGEEDAPFRRAAAIRRSPRVAAIAAAANTHAGADDTPASLSNNTTKNDMHTTTSTIDNNNNDTNTNGDEALLHSNGRPKRRASLRSPIHMDVVYGGEESPPQKGPLPRSATTNKKRASLDNKNAQQDDARQGDDGEKTKGGVVGVPSSHAARSAAISSRGHTNRGRVKQKSHKTAELMEPGTLRVYKGWYNSGYIFPEGFKSRTFFRSSVAIDSLCVHECYIEGRTGQYWPAPTFKVVALDRPDEPLIAKSCTGCWTAVLKRINAEIEARRKAGEDLPPPPKTAIAGPEYFGLNQPNIVDAVEALDPEHLCREYWAGKEDRERAAAGLHVANPSAAPRQPQAPSARSTGAVGGNGGGRRGGGRRRRAGNGSDSEDGGDPNGEEDDETQFMSNRWSAVSRTERYRQRCGNEGTAMDVDEDNPVPDLIDPITLEPVVRPAISPYGHVMGAATWKAVLAENGVCPFTKQPLRWEQCRVLTKNNIEAYRDQIIR